MTSASVNNAGNGTPRVGTYAFAAPGGEWDIGDNGTYSVVMQAGQVTDLPGNQPVAAGTIGTFTVAVPAVAIGGRVTQYVEGGPNTPLAGVTVGITGTGVAAGTTVTTNGNGDYIITNISHGGSYVLTPTGPGKVYDPITMSIGNLTTNVTNADFIAYDPAAIPRTLRAGNVYPTPGTPAAVPILLDAQGTERTVAFTIQFNTTPLGTPTVACGQSALNCTITSVQAPGQIVVTVTPNGVAVFGAGLREIAVVTFPTYATSLSNTPIDITATDIRNAVSDPLPVTAVDGQIVFAQSIEGDLALPRDNDVLSNDVTIQREFVTRALVPATTDNNEFQRADASPAFTKGDGIIDATDLTTVQAFASRNQGLQPAGGPGEPLGTNPPLASARVEINAPILLGPEVIRSIGIASRPAERGRELTVDVDLTSQGGEIAASFTLTYDARKLSNPRLAIGSEMPAGAYLSVNSREKGKLGILIDSRESLSTTSSAKSMMRITFDVNANAPGGQTRLTFDDTLAHRAVSDREGNALPTRYNDAVITIDGPAASAVEISGRVLTPDGRGLRNTQVTIIDGSGQFRTTTTGAFGHYQFDAIPSNRTYTVTVASKRYRFTARRLEVTDNLADLNFIGQQ